MSAEDSNIENGLAQTEGMDTQDPNAQAGGDITENDDERFVFCPEEMNPPFLTKIPTMIRSKKLIKHNYVEGQIFCRLTDRSYT